LDYNFKVISRADVRPEHQGPGTVKKVLIDESGSHDFSKAKFVRLEIIKYGADGGYYLMHICADGSGTDTWHATLDELLDEAEFEYGVLRTDWHDIV
jgi:hypothetical protein